MATYVTMTPKGGYGSSYQAESWEAATAQAEADGYEVLDWTEHGSERVLVIPDDPPLDLGPE